ncbi:tetratricopeptide repeat protein [Thermogutta sp.]|uniref:tetratricopeptide repeat protein n=1 Tax=Thermogutta sp. TaxID=1962930 RepID=UPI00321F9F9C
MLRAVRLFVIVWCVALFGRAHCFAADEPTPTPAVPAPAVVSKTPTPAVAQPSSSGTTGSTPSEKVANGDSIGQAQSAESSPQRIQLDLGTENTPQNSSATEPELRVRTGPSAADRAPTGVPGGDSSAEGEPRAQLDPRTSQVEIAPEPAAFNGVTPGQTTTAELLKQWGQPTDVKQSPQEAWYLFQMPPFQRVEVLVRDDKVRSIVVRLEKSYPANLVAQHLELAAIRPVYISNPQGEILGQTFPERGVIFAFAPADQPGKASNMVTDIILEELNADAFILRAETFWESEPELALRDVSQALKLDPRADRAWWLQARTQRLMGRSAEALQSIQRAVQLQPQEVQYRLDLAQILIENRQTAAAIPQLEQVIAVADQRPHVKARALCLLGDVYHAADPPDFKKALDNHYEAIKVAQALRTDPYPAYRVAAKEVLVDAHLGAARDIAWGVWEQKEAVVGRWLQRAEELAEDLVQNERQSPRALFKVAATALAVSVALPTAVDPQSWLGKLDQAYQLLVQDVSPTRKAQFQWEYGAALYDVVQHYQAREKHDLALQYGQQAIQALEAGLAGHTPSAMDHYLMGRLYFRMGAIFAIQQKKHAEATPYYDKALEHLEAAAGQLDEATTGRLGETYVSMGVSYWETGQKDRAVQLTEKGVQLMEKAVGARRLPESALTVPHSNLKTMREALSRTARAENASSGTPR